MTILHLNKRELNSEFSLEFANIASTTTLQSNSKTTLSTYKLYAQFKACKRTQVSASFGSEIPWTQHVLYFVLCIRN